MKSVDSFQKNGSWHWVTHLGNSCVPGCSVRFADGEFEDMGGLDGGFDDFDDDDLDDYGDEFAPFLSDEEDYEFLNEDGDEFFAGLSALPS